MEKKESDNGCFLIASVLLVLQNEEPFYRKKRIILESHLISPFGKQYCLLDTKSWEVFIQKSKYTRNQICLSLIYALYMGGIE